MPVLEIILRVVLVCLLVVFTAALGVIFGWLVFPSHGHGAAGLESIFIGFFSGFACGLIVGLWLAFRLTPSAIKTGILISLIGLLIEFLVVYIAGKYISW